MTNAPRRFATPQSSNLISTIAGGDLLIWIRPDIAADGGVFNAGDRRGRRANIRFRTRDIRLACTVQFVAEFVFCFLEFLDRLTHPTRQLGQLLGSEQDQDDEQNNDQIRSGQIHKAGKEDHTRELNMSPQSKVAR